MLLAFFLAPLYYVFLFSTGERYQGVNKAAAAINGELTSFSWDRWRELLGTDVTVRLLGATVTTPLWILGLCELALLAGVLRGARVPRHGGKVGVLGVSLGAQIASAASVGRAEIGALVLVDGGFPNGYSQPVRSLPPLLLIWGSADKTLPLSIGRELQRTAQQLGAPVTLDVYEGGEHDFFLSSGARNAEAAHRSTAAFLGSLLSR